MAGFERALLEGIAQLLHDQGVATWRSNGVYATGETGIVLGGLPQAPERTVALTAYGIDDAPSLSDSTTGVQVTTRWEGQDPRPVGDLTDLVFNQLHGLHATTLPTGVRLVQCLRRSWTSIGQDTNKRWRTVQNFYVDAHRPSPHRT